MKIALAQQNYHIGNFELNTQKIMDAIDRASAAGAELVVFSELCICGYPPRDFLEFNDFINKCDESIDKIKEKTEKIGVIIGSPVRNPRKEGKDLFNAAILLYKKEIQGIAQKTLLPTYDVFDEYRYFEPAWSWNVLEFGGKKIALTICEDLWNLSDNPLYRSSPMEQLIKQRPDIMINISASPFDYDHDDDRKEVLRANVNRYKIPLVYCNTVGSQTEVVFDGGSLVFDSTGNIIKEMEYFEEDFALIDTNTSLKQAPASASVTLDHLHDLDKKMRVAKVKDPEQIISYLTNENNISQIAQALILGIKDYFGKMGFTKAIIGSSGGIDSAVTVALACKALGRENVRAVLMPSQYSTDHSVSDAEQLSKNLGNPYDIIAIRDVYNAFLKSLEGIFKGTEFGIAEENIQSRTRGNLLMSIANKFGYILLNTSNKSELATGYGTLYGDMAGGLGVLGDVYKMQVFALAEYINREKEVIPKNIIIKSPSAELRPGQKDTDSLPDYSILDKILYQYIEKRQGPKELIEMGFDEQVVRKTLKLVNTNEYKRNQFCPVIRVSSKAFGVGRRMPIVGKYLS
jgi:NAD+ synthase (glutamine-hydrolysing)